MCGSFSARTQSGVTFRLVDDKKKYIVKGDAIQLQQTLLNLMNQCEGRHAGKSGIAGAGSYDPRRRSAPDEIVLDPPPEVKVPPDQSFCVIRVEDTGTGIDPAVKARIFEPFFTTKPVGKGTGMGLAMAYGTILAHNGWLQCCNLPERGAAFDIILPVADKSTKSESKRKGVSS